MIGPSSPAGAGGDIDRYIHIFTAGSVPFAYDIASGTVIVLDHVARDVLPRYVEWALARSGDLGVYILPPSVVQTHGETACREALEEFEELRASGQILRPDPLDGVEFDPPGPQILKSICLNVAHACNMRCRYCFASGGGFGGPESLMPPEVGFRAVDLLVKMSGARRRCEIDFFGGEPLVNFDAVRKIAEYAREVGAREGKEFRFTITTNSTLVDPEVAKELERLGFSVVMSIDGRKEVHDAVRRYPDGSGTYEDTVRGIRAIVSSREWSAPQEGGRGRTALPYWYVRGTYTRQNLDFVRDVEHLLELGFDRISMEPVVETPEKPWAIREEDLPRLFETYEELAGLYISRKKSGRPFAFFHFEMDLNGGTCMRKRLTGCGAGTEYAAVGPDGRIYPCHQFAGSVAFEMGDVWRGIFRDDLRDLFSAANVSRKWPCRDCWARYLCGGGCHAAAYLANGDIMRPNPIACAIQKKRLECAIFATSASAEYV